MRTKFLKAVLVSAVIAVSVSACDTVPTKELYMSRDEQIMAIHQCMSADLNPHVIYGRMPGTPRPVPVDVTCEPKWKP